MPQTILGIDIGGYSVKIAEMERSFKGFEFVRFYERKIQYNELLSPEESISVTLQGMIDDFHLKWDQAVCGYPGNRVSSRFITLPFGSLAKIDETLEFELEGYIPFDLEDLVIDYYVARSSKESSDVLAFYAVKEEFAGWLKLLQGAQLDPKVVTAEPSEFLNLVNLGMVPPEGPFAVLDIGHVKTNLAICEGKKLTLIRSISFGGKNITERLAKKLGVPLEEAERLKIEMGGLPADDPEAMDDLSAQVGEAIQASIDDLLVHIRQALFAFRDQSGTPVGGFFLCGGTSRIPRIDRYLSNRLKQNVTFIDCTTFHFYKVDNLQSHHLVLPQGLALALRGVASGRMPRINFRQGAFAFKGDVEKIGGTLRHAGVALGTIFLLGFSYFGIKYYVLSKRMEGLNDQITAMVSKVLPNPPKQLASAAHALRLLKSEETKVRDRIQKLSSIQGLSVLDVLKDISEKVPDRKAVRLDIDDLSIDENSLKFSGSVDTFEAPDKIQKALEGTPYMKKVTKGNVRKGVRPDEVKFDMTMDLEVPKT
ncbi:MAG: pilus assembly protein PilM [Deltaproteobacteria bacterium]|nr:pilus assembly protein PilM [Deltaproteobacteria bacterium]MBI4224682.1 pilus assembly protein PilM [Deltaproteobacteria bacterium]